MAERSILSSFKTRSEAENAAEQIRVLGIDVIQVDTLHAYDGEEPSRDAFPISGKIPSLANLTLHTEPHSHDAGILMAANPVASGMSDGDDSVTGRNYLLTVVCDDAKVDACVTIIKDCNGYT